MKKTAYLFVIIFFSILVSTAAAETNCNIGNNSNSEQNTGTPDYTDAGSGNVFNNVTFNNVTFTPNYIDASSGNEFNNVAFNDVTFINGPNSRNTFNNVTFNNVTFSYEPNSKIIVRHLQSSSSRTPITMS